MRRIAGVRNADYVESTEIERNENEGEIERNENEGESNEGESNKYKTNSRR